MHTFFINTSKKELKGYDVLFDIHYENKTLVSMNCPMSDWFDNDNGYVACVKQMSDMIDGYVELNNSFNLIVYVDLPEYKAYSSIPRDEFHDKDRDECCRAMHILFTHVISNSIVHKLVDSGRRPQNVLIMFGEEKKFTDFNVSPNDPGKQKVMNKVFTFIGLPDADIVVDIAKAVHADDVEDKVSSFRDRIFAICGEELIPGIRDGYSNELQLWCDEIINEAKVPEAADSLFERISNINRMESDRIGIEIVSCPYDCYACKVNKSMLALSELNIAIYLLECIELNSIFVNSGDENTKSLLEFHSYTVEEIGAVLEAKKKIYEEKITDIESFSKSYADMELARRLSAFDYAKFGLDMYGDKATDLVINDVVDEKSDKKSEKKEDSSEKTDEQNDTIFIKGNDKEVTVTKRQGRVLFLKEEYQPFDYYLKEGSALMLKKNTKPEQYIKHALNVRKHHLDYLKKVKIQVSQVLSNYAGKSKENKPALLQMGGERYATKEYETQVLEAVEKVSEKAYESMVNQYMEFCAGRSVAISDIEEQCNWFISRVHQIKDSLSKIKRVAIGLLVAIIALYIPFIVIQFDAIVKNALTLVTAMASFAVPVLLLYFIFTVIAATQRKKYIEAWLEFEKRSDLALEENRIAVQKYDQLLSVVIPALRWVYEYKLDVDYCVECCSVADAKIEHHRRKLRDRVSAIQNILSDLEFKESEDDESDNTTATATDDVDYNVSFCTGKKNRSFYSVIDGKALAQPEH